MSTKNVEIMRGNPENAVRKLAFPIIISMTLSSLYNIIDGIWIAGLGQNAIAGIGFVSPIFLILIGVSMGLGNGATSSISRFIGAENKENASRSAEHSILIFAVSSIILTAILLLIQEPLLRIYGASGQSLIEGLKYGTPLYLGLFTFVFSYGLAGILRGEGDMKRAMYAIVFGVILNALFDPLFIYILNLGSSGAAIATIASSLSTALIILYWILVKKDTFINLNIRNFKFDSKIAESILKVGIPASMDMIIMAISTSLYLVFISSVGGDYGIASFTSGQRLYFLGIMPLTAIGAAIVAVVASAYGAKNRENISRAHKYGTRLAMMIGLIVTGILLIFSSPLAHLFAYTPETMKLIPGIALFLQITPLCLPFNGLGIPSNTLYQGLGNGITSLLWTIIRELIFTVLLTYALGIGLGFGIIGIWAGLALGRGSASLLNYVFSRYSISKLNF